MKTSNPKRWGLALALVVGLGLAYAAGLLSSTSGISAARISKLWSHAPVTSPTAAIALKRAWRGLTSHA
ncbi:hypothetical protein J2X15_001427 [Rhodoferax saidenbachensis]|uniref:Uncharacterized protein n=1 Tax=Rhodoferax saidenbachensis TaxID=1484693 RepID=A0ABU1ZKS5_9BURK|nr:hypothetical protein [Rhodoferax saidenbachensis]